MCSQTHTHTHSYLSSVLYLCAPSRRWFLCGSLNSYFLFQTLRLYVYWPRPFEDAAEKGQKAFTTIIKKHGKEEIFQGLSGEKGKRVRTT